MSVPEKPLGLVKDLIETLGFEITYAYEDLIFIEHNAFLLQMPPQGPELGVWFNVDCNVEERPVILSKLQKKGTEFGLKPQLKGTYTMEQQGEEESLQIVFN